MRRALHALATLSEKWGTATVVVRHLNKSSGGNPLYRGGGSIGIIGAARAGMLVAPDPSDDSRRILAMTKSNLAPMPPALAYRLVPDEIHAVARVKWEGPTEHKVGELLQDRRADEGQDAVGEAMEILRNILADGEVPAKRVKALTRDADLSDITVRRARERLGIKPRKVGQPGEDKQYWVWELPDRRCSPNPEDVHPERLSTFERLDHLRGPNGARP